MLTPFYKDLKLLKVFAKYFKTLTVKNSMPLVLQKLSIVKASLHQKSKLLEIFRVICSYISLYERILESLKANEALISTQIRYYQITISNASLLTDNFRVFSRPLVGIPNSTTINVCFVSLTSLMPGVLSLPCIY